MITKTKQTELTDDGFTIVEGLYTGDEVEALLQTIRLANTAKPAVRRSPDVFAIRQFLKEVPQAATIIFSEKMRAFLRQLLGDEYALVKSIFFDKPGNSNWAVPYHQDLTIGGTAKVAITDFNHWTMKEGQYAVQPPLDLLENNFTIRIHLDDTNEHNGTLRVVPGSHRMGICRPETMNNIRQAECICRVPKGGAMIMRPLLLHASGKSTENLQRRVIHLEFSKQKLPAPLQWAEYFAVDKQPFNLAITS
jgi:ectoine hydroxylase-related dioxygenase (phytanoyl-CoA dioxygenase family)